MLLDEPDVTPFDISWRMLGTHVRVSGWFWAVSMFLGWNALELGFEYVLIWVGCVFVSVLLHEFGHVFMGRLFGSYGRIVLHSFGGLAIGINVYRTWPRVLVSLAGPGIQLLFLLLLWPVFPLARAAEIRDRHFWWLLRDLWVINLYWPLLNLLPIWPLDGGQITRNLLMSWRRDGLRASLMISVVTAGLLAVEAFLETNGRPIVRLGIGGNYNALFFAMLAFSSFQILQATPPGDGGPGTRGSGGHRNDDRLPWESDPDAWKRR